MWGCSWRGKATELVAHEKACSTAWAAKENASLKQQVAILEARVASFSSMEVQVAEQHVCRFLDMRNRIAQTLPCQEDSPPTHDLQIQRVAHKWEHVLQTSCLSKRQLVALLLFQEQERLQSSPLTIHGGFKFEPYDDKDEDDDYPLKWHCWVPGIPGTLMHGALFDFKMIFSEDFPKKPPLVKSAQAGFPYNFHPNWYPSGKDQSVQQHARSRQILE